MDTERKLGPNTRQLLAHFIAREAVPTGGGLAAGLNFLVDADRRKRGMEKAWTDMQTALSVVKSAPDNPYGDDDEVIAAAILARIEAHKE